ncbi:helix-turn-helix transcriptional regulator [Micromonospora sp. NPDC023814]|uniref:helix-turn-helix domain-containing protein n=1 Tax=Micromonospora sp. NPDC023814 TaxID=3154596 RepID=UPI0033D9C027
MLETQGRQTPDQPRVRLRLDQIDRITTALGHTTDSDRAAFLGISPAALSKIRNGVNAPSEKTIAAICSALPRVPFERLFVITTTESEEKG